MSKRFSVCYLLVISLFVYQSAYASTQYAYPDLVASIPGNFSVSNSGSAQYSIPLELPPGTAGVQPELSFTYSSEGDNGLLGVGWSIGGLSVIHRCPATILRDGFTDGIDFDSNDRFCLDGQPLIAINNGIYGANGTQYRTEIDGFSKVVSYGSTGNGPSYFKVWTKSGDIMEYGVTDDSRINPPKADGSIQLDALQWSLNKISDRSGNYMTISYFEDITSGESYPISIQYTGRTPNLTPYNEVRFVYENRPDFGSKYIGGLKMLSSKRLVSVIADTKLPNDQVITNLVEYKIMYLTNGSGTSEDTGRSLVHRIDKCDKNALCVGATSMTSSRSINPSKWTQDTSFNPPFPLAMRVNTSVGIQDAGARFIDLNGDGLQDVVRHNTFGGSTPPQIDAYINDGSGWQDTPAYELPVRIQALSGNSSQGFFDMGTRFVDLNGDGLQDVVIGNFSEKHAYLNSGSGWVAAPNYNPPENIVEFVSGLSGFQDGGVRFIDLNGDGLKDLIKSSYISQSNQTNTAYLNTGSGWQSAPQYVSPVWMVFRYSTLPFSNFGLQDNGVRFVDLNADGMVDMLHHLYSGPGNTTSSAYINTGNGWLSAPEFIPPVQLAHLTNANVGVQDAGVRFVDLNGDGLQDMLRHVYWGVGANSNGYTTNSQSVDAYLNTGTGWVAEPVYNPFISTVFFTSANLGLQDLGARIVDMNGDGLPDMLRSIYYTSSLTSSNTYLNTGNGWLSDSSLNSPLITVRNEGGTLGFQDSGTRFIDIDGDGLEDVVNSFLNGSIGTSFAYKTDAMLPDIATTILNGLLVEVNIDYKPLTDAAVYTKGSGAAFPVIDVQPSMYVVSETRTGNNGVGGVNTLTYSYEGAKMHVQGRGYLGFNKRSVNDVGANTRIDTTYRQDFPYIGLASSTKTYVDSKLITDQSNIFAAIGDVTIGPAFPFPQFNINQEYDLVDSAWLGYTYTYTTFDSYGNPLQIQTINHSLETSNQYKTTTVNTYSNDGGVNWLLGRLLTASVTKQKTENGVTDVSQTRVSNFTYNSFTGQLLSEAIEPGSSMELKKVYTYDQYGNNTSTITSGSNIATRTSTTTYDNKGRYPVTLTNALGHIETHEYNDPWGNITKLTGPNNLDTLWEYDTLGRRVKETRADGTQTTISYTFCTNTAPCPSLASSAYSSYYVTTTTDGAPVGRSYFDAANREVLSTTENFTGDTISTQTEYDAQARVKRTSLPYTGATPGYWNNYTYDDLGRVTQENSSANGTTTYIYDGQQTTVTNDLNQQLIEYKNRIGQTLWTEDDSGNRVLFTYDAAGNLTDVSDGTNTTTNTYDIRGFKTSMSDPDMGTWTYTYNVLGELISQTDAKSQVTNTTYDLLGRIKTRTSTEGTTTWNYDTAINGKGKLHNIVHYNGYTRTISYDLLGRPSDTDVMVGGIVYSTSNTYDAYSRIDEITYPTGYKIKQEYNVRGYLSKVVDATNPTTVHWEGVLTDQFGNYNVSSVGGVFTAHLHEASSGRLENIYSGSGGIQHLTYTYDTLGNLTKRKDNKQIIEEDFVYDNINRLTTATVVGVGSKNYSYDTLGNITTKSDVGSYTYGENNAGPHALTKTVQGQTTTTYTYDDNGNMTGGNGRAITWSSFNKPTQIHQGANTVSFEYGPDRQRYLQTASDGATTKITTYIGGLYEKEVIGSLVTNKHYIRAAGQTIAIHTTRSNSVNDTRYLHRDHLGSVDVITDENQMIVEALSFDAFGQRRQTNWSSAISQITSSISRGYTGHEQLDSVGLIHMNGRVYDPTLGRFISADPFVQQPKNLQSLNRYSYVVNNPLSYADPSGFFFKKLKKFFKKAVRSVKKVFKGAARAVKGALNKIATNPYLSVAASIAVGWGAGYLVLQSSWVTTLGSFAKVAAGAAGGFAGGFVGSGGDIRAGILGGLTGAAAGFVAGLNLPTHEAAVAHGVVGGVSAEAQGGKFGQGFASSFLTKAVSADLRALSYDNPIAGGVAAAVVGGTVSQLTGGKFKNGAITASFQYLFNEASKLKKTRPHSGRVVGSPHPDGRFSSAGLYRRNADGSPRPHLGVDFAGEIGDPIFAAADGQVSVCPASSCRSSGNQVSISHSDGTYTRYFHLDTLSVSNGQSVNVGDVIGTLGVTGNAINTSQPHLHFEVRQGSITGMPLDPMDWLNN